MWVIRVLMPWRFFFLLPQRPSLLPPHCHKHLLPSPPFILLPPCSSVSSERALHWPDMEWRWGGVGVAGKHKEIRQEVREGANLGKWKVRTNQHLIASRCYVLFGGSAWTSDLNLCLIRCPNLTPDLHSLCPGQPGMRGKKLVQWCLERPIVEELQGTREVRGRNFVCWRGKCLTEK